MKYLALFSFLGLFSACGSPAATPSPSSAARLAVTSTAFADGSSIPVKYTCQGESISPPLKWTSAPAATASYALIVEDPDAPSGTFTHWVAFDLPASQTELPEGARVAAEVESNADTPAGPFHNRYHFLFEVRDGLVVVAKEYADSLYMYMFSKRGKDAG